MHKPLVRALAAASLAALSLSFAATGAQASLAGIPADEPVGGRFEMTVAGPGALKGGRGEFDFLGDEAFVRHQSAVLNWSSTMRTAVDAALSVVIRNNPEIFGV